MFSGIDLTQTVLYLVAVVLSISFHEFFHAWSAYKLGDSTAKQMGRLTLNPVAHFDPLGALMIVYMAIGGRGLGWGKPVPVNPYNMRGNPRVNMGLTAAAGPFSNLLLATVAAIPFRLGLTMPDLLAQLVWVMVITNISLAVFNLIPLPPLDGFSIIQGVLATVRARWANDLGHRLDRLAPYGPIALLALLALGWFGGLNVLGSIMEPLMTALLRLLLGI